MSQNSYISTEVKKILNSESYPPPQNVAMASAWIMGNLKGINLKVLDVSKKSSLADFFVIGSATNPIQAKSMANEILVQMKKNQVGPVSKEGEASSDWVLIDLGDVLVHIFQDLTREIYDLDSLWKEASSIEIPQSYYFSSFDENEQDDDSKDRHYF